MKHPKVYDQNERFTAKIHAESLQQAESLQRAGQVSHAVLEPEAETGEKLRVDNILQAKLYRAQNCCR